jgi:hypothetical protein
VPSPAARVGDQLLRRLAGLVAVEALLLIAFAIFNLWYDLSHRQTSSFKNSHDAVVVAIGLAGLLAGWGAALLWAARAALRARTWSFSLILFTQMMGFALLAVAFSGAAGTLKIVLGLLLVLVVATGATLFHPQVRYRLGRGPNPAGR